MLGIVYKEDEEMLVITPPCRRGYVWR